MLNWSLLIKLFILGGLAGYAFEYIVDKIQHDTTSREYIKGIPFLPVYGFGLIAIYHINTLGYSIIKRILVYAVTLTLIEYFAGLFVGNGRTNKYWNYKKHILNFQGTISLGATLTWTGLALMIERFLPHIIRLIT